MKFKKFLLFVLIFCSLGNMVFITKAQNIGEIQDFRISYFGPGETTYVLKTSTKRDHVLNLLDTGGPVINVFYTLHNANDERKSPEAKLATRKIGYAKNDNAYLDGSWSPDKK